ncbi:NTF2-related export protein 2 [Acropora cervicornis]|uniref:NTF2-related export protein n=1 Tax=Acropora cervicornis TaxID=6130 RepID=A0AAD9PYC1_ACRCE|nr:PREDICTED: NTF2-related export protein 2-like [Acropora digitifera]KAK2551106.1 NTF2-related export protein 2 [Acropora cervicornis]
MATKVDGLRNAAEQATQAGEEFSNVYYETFDKRRHLMSKLYSSDTTIVWNGNVVKGGSEVVTEFFNGLPATEHTLHSLDCQPVSDHAIPGQTTVLVIVEGLVKFDGHKAELFSQNFLLTAEGGKVWKVASDCFRFIT